MEDSPLVVESTITIGCLKIAASKEKLFPGNHARWIMKMQLILSRFLFTFLKSYLPEALELPLLDPQQLAGLSADDGSVPRCVVQDGLPEGRPNPQRTDSDCILHTDMKNLF